MKLFGRDWTLDGDVLRSGEANINLLTRRGQAAPRGTYYSTRSKSGLRALELEIRAAQDAEEALADWLTSQGYVVEYGRAGVSLGLAQDEYAAHVAVRASGLTLADAARDLAARL